MVRPIKIRKLNLPHPEITFSPINNDLSKKEKVILLTEEYEAIKLIDYEYMNHSQASKIMGISRPTFTRIYNRAREKIATALVEIKSLELQTGNTFLKGNWWKCNLCDSEFNIPDDDFFKKNCPVCFSSDIKNL